ncbi:MAG: STAS domain-containing protein [Planctomycetota bacterium]|nr:STAS domain-containing protein [Planctomycetota bacterium]
MRQSGQVPILRVAGVLLVAIQVDLGDTVATALQEDVLEAIARTGSTGLLIDVTGLEMVDSFVARVLVDTGRMARLMGTETVIVGLRPEVAGTLVRMGFDVSEVQAALDIDEGLERLGCKVVRRAAD